MAQLDEVLIRNLIEERKFSHKDVSNLLRSYGVNRGSSVPNIARFCIDHNIHKYDYGRMSDHELATTTNGIVNEVGPTYGRKMVTGDQIKSLISMF